MLVRSSCGLGKTLPRYNYAILGAQVWKIPILVDCPLDDSEDIARLLNANHRPRAGKFSTGGSSSFASQSLEYRRLKDPLST